jgi:hypothetical protein
MLCDRALLHAYLQKSRAIDADVMTASAQELGLHGTSAPRRAAGGGAL